MTKKGKRKLPEQDNLDAIHLSLKTATAAVPMVGGSLSIWLFEQILKPPIQKKMEKFLEELAEDIYKLNENYENLPKLLTENDIFIRCVAQACQIASRSSDEKLFILRNAVVNSFVLENISENKKEIFIQLLDILTPSHMKVMKHIEKSNIHARDLDIIFQKHFENQAELECTITYELFILIINELSNKSLINLKDMSITTHIPGILYPDQDFQSQMVNDLWEERNNPPIPRLSLEITELGKEFLTFITIPRVPSITERRKKL